MLHSSHGGDIYRNHISIDFSINVNPLGVPRSVKEALIAQLDHLDAYPDPECQELVTQLSCCHQVPEESILCANGAAELIYLLVQVKKPKKALVLSPTFLEYEEALQNVGCEIVHYVLQEEKGFIVDIETMVSLLTADLDLVFFCNPNNPTGIPVRKEDVAYVANCCHQKGIFLVLDECFCEFLDTPQEYSLLDQITHYPELLILRAFTKIYGMAGLRLGYGITANHELLSLLRKARQPWSVSLPAQIAGVAALGEMEYVLRAKEIIKNGREFLKIQLTNLGFTVYPSEANYLLFHVTENVQQYNLWTNCKERGILIRDCSNIKGLELGYYRVCVRTMEENQILIDTLRSITNDAEGEKQG